MAHRSRGEAFFRGWLGVSLAFLAGIASLALAGCTRSPEEQRGAEQRRHGIHTVEGAVQFFLEAAETGDLAKAQVVTGTWPIPEGMLSGALVEVKTFLDSVGGSQNVTVVEDVEAQMGSQQKVRVQAVDSPRFLEFSAEDHHDYLSVSLEE